MRCVLDHDEIVAASDIEQFRHPTRHAPKMRHDDGASARRDLAFDIVRIEAQPFHFRFRKYRHRPDPQHRNDRRPERRRRYDHLIARFRINGKKRRQQRSRSIAMSERMWNAQVPTVIILQLTRHLVE